MMKIVPDAYAALSALRNLGVPDRRSAKEIEKRRKESALITRKHDIVGADDNFATPDPQGYRADIQAHRIVCEGILYHCLVTREFVAKQPIARNKAALVIDGLDILPAQAKGEMSFGAFESNIPKSHDAPVGREDASQRLGSRDQLGRKSWVIQGAGTACVNSFSQL